MNETNYIKGKVLFMESSQTEYGIYYTVNPIVNLVNVQSVDSGYSYDHRRGSEFYSTKPERERAYPCIKFTFTNGEELKWMYHEEETRDQDLQRILNNEESTL